MVRTPLIVGKWEAGLAAHPDREFSCYVIRGIRSGFRIGFEYWSGTGFEVSKNMRSASEHPEPINAYVGSELSAGRMIQVAADTPGLRVSRFGVIPKHHWVRLNVSFRSDLRWWEIFLEEWNGVSLCGGVVPVSPKDTITSDASGRWGCGAFTERGEWFQYRWPAEWESVHITVKELLPIVRFAAAATMRRLSRLSDRGLRGTQPPCT